MLDDDIRRVRDSYAALGDTDAFGRRFYATLLRLRPDARALFPADLDMQVRKFVDMLAAIVNGLDMPAQLLREAGELGRRHLAYGVREDDYDDAGAALLMALHEHLGDAFTPATEQAWATAYADIAEAMIAAAHAADTA